jgi:hypothetical protein
MTSRIDPHAHAFNKALALLQSKDEAGLWKDLGKPIPTTDSSKEASKKTK